MSRRHCRGRVASANYLVWERVCRTEGCKFQLSENPRQVDPLKVKYMRLPAHKSMSHAPRPQKSLPQERHPAGNCAAPSLIRGLFLPERRLLIA